MASNSPQSPRNLSTPSQSIPLQDLARPPDDTETGPGPRGHNRGRSLLSGPARTRSGHDVRYERLVDASPTATDRRPLPTDHLETGFSNSGDDSSVGDLGAFQTAMGFAGLSTSNDIRDMPTIAIPDSYGMEENDGMTPYPDNPYLNSGDSDFHHMESDQIPLTNPNYLQPISGAQNPSTPRHSQERSSFSSVHFGSPESRSRGARLGDDLAGIEAQYGHSRSHSYGDNLSPDGRNRSRSPSNASPISRAGSIMRAMSQRVVNLSNDPEPPENVFRRSEPIGDEPQLESIPHADTTFEPTENHPGLNATPEKMPPASVSGYKQDSWPEVNPLRGKTLGIFSPANPVRTTLCQILVHPLTEFVILALIILQTILLAVDASGSVYDHPRSQTWGTSNMDYAFLALFLIYTVELSARVIVSGFFLNPIEHSTRDRQEGLLAAIHSKYRSFFGPQKHMSVNRPVEPQNISSSIVRSLTGLAPNSQLPASAREQRRNQLARRAFLRHSLNRIDFIAVVSFWLSFFLSITGVESAHHMYAFRMLSCLRILRLLWLTNGTSIILKSLKKAAPLLVNVSFLIGFFWLLFAIVGVQAFKSSLSRQCVWIDPLGQNNFTNEFTLCGGHHDNQTGAELPWVYANGQSGATSSKGFICPRGSLCVEDISLHNGTVNFDNIIQSLELVFVVMSANTFTDLMYYTTNSDYLVAALFFVAGIVIMMLWLTNLLIAVITSSFQVIREESKKSAFTAMEEPLLPIDEDEFRKRSSTLKQWYDKTSWIWILVILYGLVCQGTRSADMSPAHSRFLLISEIVVTFLLFLETVIRFASDWRNFHRHYNYLFDAALAIITMVILLPPILNSGQVYAWLTAFQIIRIYRIVWAVPITQELISKVLGNSTGILNLVLFVFLITFLVAILAVQLFRGELPEEDADGETIEVTFFTLWNAFLGMYQILSSENWTTILYNITSYDSSLHIGWIGAIFFISWFILAYFILINMFIAVIQENFDVSEDEKRLQQVKVFLQRKEDSSSASNLSLSTIFKFGRSNRAKDPLDYGQAAMEMLLKDAVVKDFLDEENDTIQPTPIVDRPARPESFLEVRYGFFVGLWHKFLTRVWHREPNPFYSSLHFPAKNKALDPRAMAKEAVSATTLRKKAQRDFLGRHPNYNTSLYIFKPTNPIRRFCQKIVGPGRGTERFDGVEPNRIVWYTFSAVIYATVLSMVVLACITTPLYQKEYFMTHRFTIKNWFVWTDMAFAIVFSIESIIKIIADGAFWTPNAYLRSLWGLVDALVLVTLWINVTTSFLNDGAVSRAVGAFKALRALRLLNISDSARDTFQSVVFVGGWRVISAAFVSLSLLIPFAIYGVNLFNGQMVSCNDGGSSIVNLWDCVGEFNSTPFSNEWNVTAPRIAANPYYDFDDFGGALFILFQIVSQEGWIDVMWSAQSVTGRGLQPQPFTSQGNAVFFVVFNLMATVFVLTLFISVFMRTYTEQTGVAFLTSEQRSWMELRKLLRQVAPSKRPAKEGNSPWKVWCYKRAVRKHGRWHRAVTFVLFLHLVLLMLEYYPEPNWWVRTRDYLFLAFTVFYVANIFIRIVGLTWSRFRRSSWDMFSLVAVGGTIITTILLLTNYSLGVYVQLHKLFLVSMALLLIPRNNSLDQLFKTAAASLTNIGNLLATWLVVFLVYAIAMTQTFSLTRFGSQGTNNLNFRTVPKALIVLFRMSVGEGWNEIMEDYATAVPPFCVENTEFFDSDCGSPGWARGLFLSWNIISMYIFVSLFVSLIYESFSYVYQQSSGLSIVTRDETRRFKQAWATFDPEGTGYITKTDFPRLLGELSGVFAMRIYDEEDSVRRILEDVKSAPATSRAASVATVSGAIGIDLAKLNARIAQIDAKKARKRRQRYNIFYEEVMVSADPDRGISFNSVLMTLAHYNVISDSKSLKLDEFLRRRARLQRVEEEVSRRVVQGFFDTMWYSRRFQRYKNRHTLARMTDIPQFEVPEIIVDDEDEGGPSKVVRVTSAPLAFTSDGPDSRASFREAFGLDGSHSRTASAEFEVGGSAVSSPSPSPRLGPHRPTMSGQSFDILEPRSAGHSRRGSAVSAENALEVFSESAWGESLRRSFTSKQSRGGSS